MQLVEVWVVVAVLGTLVLCFGGFLWNMVGVIQLGRRGIGTVGTCVDRAYGRYGSSPVVEFSRPDGSICRVIGGGRFISALDEGDQVDVVYDPKRPGNAKLAAEIKREFRWSVLAVGIFVLFVVPGCVAVVSLIF
ncbi:hypothetical protein [Streptomyces sp. CA-146814]|uniref:hypothetical protein n=1 Tax=Streptomyces sp. CA-146814 TaxID=3240053 RepID=UPI003D8D20C7